jgi:hypothetical protein
LFLDLDERDVQMRAKAFFIGMPRPNAPMEENNKKMNGMHNLGAAAFLFLPNMAAHLRRILEAIGFAKLFFLYQ